MKFLVSLIAVYVYFSTALVDSFKNFTYNQPEVQNELIIEITEPENTMLARVAMAKTACFVEKSGVPL